MFNLLCKPIDEISVEDLQELIDQKVPENEQLEYKSTLPSKQGKDIWFEDQTDIGKYAKTCILEEVVAFANAHGGVLIVGVEELENTKHIAGSIKELPNCEDLVDRLKNTFRDLVEPALSTLELKCIQTNQEAGVLFVRVGKSRSAPHRVKPSKRCTIRRQDRKQELSMLEIQELTLNTTRGLERIAKKGDYMEYYTKCL